MKSRLKAGRFIVAGLALLAGSCAHASEFTAEALPELLRSRSFLDQQNAAAGAKIETFKRMISHSDNDDEIDDLEDYLEILRFLRRNLSEVGASDAELIRANANAYRILSSLKLEEPKEKLPPVNVLFRNIVWGNLFGHGIPLVEEIDRQKPAGAAALAESAFLYDERRQAFHLREDLASLTPEQIADLDIDPMHPAWLSRRQINSQRSTRLQEFERKIENGKTRYLQREGDLAKGRRYSIAAARRVLFLDEVYLSATSPKAETEDAYGVEWKLKWGDEPAVEPVASRLYLLAGGRETDLVFANGPGKESLTLVLDEPGAADEGEKDDETRHASTVDELKAALDDLYGFDLTPYILDSGEITTANAGKVLRYLVADGKSECQQRNLIGRHWVTFKESGVELKAKGFIRREDGATLNDGVSVHDRVYRGLYLFDLWIENGDVKQGNQKAFYRKGPLPAGGWGIRQYAEGHHDLGLSLGGLLSSGETNRFRTGARFAYRGGKKLRFKAPLLHKPEVWKAATWADGKWMARHIASITTGQIKAAVATSLWPDFVQEALVYRLVDRRNRIAQLFDETNRLDAHDAEPPQFVVALNSSESLADLERRYELPAGALATEIAENRSMHRPFELVLKDGVIASTSESLFMRALVRHRYPSGIVDRYQRTGDRGPQLD